MFGRRAHTFISPCWMRINIVRTYSKKAKMENAYVRYLDNANQFQLCLQFKNQNLGIDRQFNFNRRTSEKVSELLGRINTSFDKTLSKTKKKRKKASGPTVEQVPEIKAELIENGAAVAGESICKDVLLKCDGPSRNLCLKILGMEYVLVVNAPWVDNITLPTCIMAKYPVYPTKLELSFVNREHCLFSWSKISADCIGKENETWTEVGTGFVYEPSTSDIGCLLKLSCIPVKGDQHGPTFEVVSKNVVESGPGECPFQQRHAFTPERLEGNNFRVVSYNILADLYADSETARKELFPYCPQYALHIDYRKQLIIKELIGFNADLICLQEVDCKVFDLDLQPVLGEFGYRGIHHKKNGQVSEGVACIFHAGKFKLVESYNKYLGDEIQVNPLFSDLWSKILQNKALETRFKERTTSVQVTVLDSVTDPNERLVIGNTHLYFHPTADHIRLLQATMAVRYLEQLASASKVEGKRVSVLLCGDFNSTPEFGVYHLMTTQHVPSDHMDWSCNQEEAISGVALSHSLPLASACGTPEFTNYTVGFVGCLDYIFYQQNQIAVNQVVPLPSMEEVQLHTALPSVVFPSDHVSLVCDLRFIPP